MRKLNSFIVNKNVERATLCDFLPSILLQKAGTLWCNLHFRKKSYRAKKIEVENTKIAKGDPQYVSKILHVGFVLNEVLNVLSVFWESVNQVVD